jgi:hypothetical protein
VLRQPFTSREIGYTALFAQPCAVLRRRTNSCCRLIETNTRVLQAPAHLGSLSLTIKSVAARHTGTSLGRTIQSRVGLSIELTSTSLIMAQSSRCTRVCPMKQVSSRSVDGKLSTWVSLFRCLPVILLTLPFWGMTLGLAANQDHLQRSTGRRRCQLGV